MSRVYSAVPVDRGMANALFREEPEDDEEDEDEKKDDEERMTKEKGIRNKDRSALQPSA
jgi:hypothetical protein